MFYPGYGGTMPAPSLPTVPTGGIPPPPPLPHGAGDAIRAAATHAARAAGTMLCAALLSPVLGGRARSSPARLPGAASGPGGVPVSDFALNSSLLSFPHGQSLNMMRSRWRLCIRHMAHGCLDGD